MLGDGTVNGAAVLNSTLLRCADLAARRLFVLYRRVVVEFSIPAVLQQRAGLLSDETAFTFVDYQEDWAGVAQSLTWSQLHRRTSNLAQQLMRCGATGDRAVILAPQGLDYIVCFVAALQAGLIAVPLSVPYGAHTTSAPLRCWPIHRPPSFLRLRRLLTI